MEKDGTNARFKVIFALDLAFKDLILNRLDHSVTVALPLKHAVARLKNLIVLATGRLHGGRVAVAHVQGFA